MGFFSDLCIECGHPALSVWAANEINDWMIQVVVIIPSSTPDYPPSIVIGEYDGYGRVNDMDVVGSFEETLYHLACWRKAGQPMEYRGPSKFAPDQGYFFNDEHNMKEPKPVVKRQSKTLAELDAERPRGPK